jgi:hypothetical protein
MEPKKTADQIYTFDQISPLLVALYEIRNGKSSSIRKYNEILTNTAMALLAKDALDEFEKLREEEGNTPSEPTAEEKGKVIMALWYEHDELIKGISGSISQIEFNKAVTNTLVHLYDKYILAREEEGGTPAHPVNQEIRELEWRASALYYTLEKILPYAEARLPRTLVAEIEERLKMGALPSLKQEESVLPSDNHQELDEVREKLFGAQLEIDKRGTEITFLQVQINQVRHLCGTVNFSSYNQMREAIEGTLEILGESGLQASPTKKEEGE